MCQICKDLKDKKLTSYQAYEALGKMAQGKLTKEQREHILEVSDKILEGEVPVYQVNKEVEEAWHNSMYKKDDE